MIIFQCLYPCDMEINPIHYNCTYNWEWVYLTPLTYKKSHKNTHFKKVVFILVKKWTLKKITLISWSYYPKLNQITIAIKTLLKFMNLSILITLSCQTGAYDKCLHLNTIIWAHIFYSLYNWIKGRENNRSLSFEAHVLVWNNHKGYWHSIE